MPPQREAWANHRGADQATLTQSLVVACQLLEAGLAIAPTPSCHFDGRPFVDAYDADRTVLLEGGELHLVHRLQPVLAQSSR